MANILKAGIAVAGAVCIARLALYPAWRFPLINKQWAFYGFHSISQYAGRDSQIWPASVDIATTGFYMLVVAAVTAFGLWLVWDFSFADLFVAAFKERHLSKDSVSAFRTVERILNRAFVGAFILCSVIAIVAYFSRYAP